jgi:hypothetical protein
MCVSDTSAVERVLFGPQGVEESLADGMTIVDSSTISPSATRQFAERVGARGVRYVGAPMTGSKVAAEAGTLIFIVGGEDLDRIPEAVVRLYGRYFSMGETSKGQAAKLAMNLQIALIYEGSPKPDPGHEAGRTQNLIGVIQASRCDQVWLTTGRLSSSSDFTPLPVAPHAQRHWPGARPPRRFESSCRLWKPWRKSTKTNGTKIWTTPPPSPAGKAAGVEVKEPA